MRSRLYLLLILIQVWHVLPAQQKADSLLAALKRTREDSNRVNTYSELAAVYYHINEDSSQLFAEQGARLAEKVGFTKGRYQLIFQKAAVLVLHSKYAEAQAIYDSCLTYYQSISNKKQEAKIHGAMAIAYWLSGINDKAYDNQYKALTIYEMLKDSTNLVDAYNNGGLILKDWGVSVQNVEYLQRAYQYHLKSLTYCDTIHNNYRSASAYNNMALVFVEMYKYKKDKQLLLDAESYLNRSLAIKKALGNKRKIALNISGLGNVYFEMGEYKKALAYFNEAYITYRELDAINSISVSCLNIGDCYRLMNQPAVAVNYYLEGIRVAAGSGNPGELPPLYENISWAYRDLKNFEKAYEYHVKYSTVKDSLLNEDNVQKLAEMSERFESEKKDKELLRKDAELSKQQLENQRKATQRNVLIGGISFMAVLVFFILRGYRQKQRANVIITKQKQEVEQQKHLIEEKQKEILDSIHYAKRIQQSLLPNEKYVERALNHLTGKCGK